MPAPTTNTGSNRALEANRARALTEQADRCSVMLEAILAALRSPRLGDRAARQAATEVATNTLVELRTWTIEHRAAVVEPVTGAFERLRRDLGPLLRYGELDVQFVEPPANGRALPGEVAHAARAIVRNAVLTFADAGQARRVRIEWGCDGLNLLVGIRDDGAGDIDAHDDSLRPIVEQVSHLDGTMRVASTPGWGTEMNITIPLDPPEPALDGSDLTDREREIMRQVASGARNREIADEIGVSEHTVKFHVSKLLRRTGTRNRAELAALLH
ncbi:LuxR C-terminal-related transcriptional regulator [Microbacterium sp.]|uniref:LuxR C-terminal-related transcriptional regulator n=1 Tax=Microbacterium sp. TaxID=51671 RepID=UPI003F99B955